MPSVEQAAQVTTQQILAKGLREYTDKQFSNIAEKNEILGKIDALIENIEHKESSELQADYDSLKDSFSTAFTRLNSSDANRRIPQVDAVIALLKSAPSDLTEYTPRLRQILTEGFTVGIFSSVHSDAFWQIFDNKLKTLTSLIELTQHIDMDVLFSLEKGLAKASQLHAEVGRLEAERHRLMIASGSSVGAAGDSVAGRAATAISSLNALQVLLVIAAPQVLLRGLQTYASVKMDDGRQASINHVLVPLLRKSRSSPLSKIDCEPLRDAFEIVMTKSISASGEKTMRKRWPQINQVITLLYAGKDIEDFRNQLFAILTGKEYQLGFAGSLLEFFNSSARNRTEFWSIFSPYLQSLEDLAALQKNIGDLPALCRRQLLQIGQARTELLAIQSQMPIASSAAATTATEAPPAITHGARAPTPPAAATTATKPSPKPSATTHIAKIPTPPTDRRASASSSTPAAATIVAAAAGITSPKPSRALPPLPPQSRKSSEGGEAAPAPNQ
jgi:hypothetical protein